jgi:PKD repeat protein
LQERDAILSAASVFGADDVNDVREGFRVRGMGFSASIQSTSPASVTEAYDTWGTPNQPPTASFTFACTGLTCNFNGSASNDPDGSIVSYAWNFGDGTTGTGVSPSKTYSSSGTRTVTLTVTDNGNATGSTSQSVTVTAPTNITLSVSTRRRGNRTFADLSWTGASGSVNVFRNGSVIATVTGTTYTDNLGRGSGSATYQVCNAGTTTCSNSVTITY